MRGALRAEYRAAIPAYDEKPRGRWIFDHSVQSTITVSRTFFTQEVGRGGGAAMGGGPPGRHLKEAHASMGARVTDFNAQNIVKYTMLGFMVWIPCNA